MDVNEEVTFFFVFVFYFGGRGVGGVRSDVWVAEWGGGGVR